MKFLLALFAFFATSTAFAHPGHTDMVAGHSHSFAELSAFGAGMALIAIAALVIAVGAKQ